MDERAGKNEWITKATVSEIKKRDALWAKHRKFSSDRNYKAYKAVRNRVTRLIRTDKVQYQRNWQSVFGVILRDFTDTSGECRL